jgi:predicted small metal-binding protein
MKIMTCKELGGACDLEFKAETFEEIAEQSKAHGTEMWETKEPAHIKAMEEMSVMMQKPEEMQKWMEERKQIFESR